MRKNRRLRNVAMVGSFVLAAAMTMAPAFGQADFDVVASGLLSPRHLTFSPNGKLYVVEAGNGGTSPCAIHPDLGEFCLGSSGGVTLVRDNGPDPRVVSGLPSISNAVPQQFGASDIAFQGAKNFVIAIGLGGSDQFRDEFGEDGVLLGTLVTGKLGDDDVSLFADVIANEADANPDGTDIDSNPVGLFRHGQRYVVADAGGNAVVRASNQGSFTTVTALPPGSALAPPFVPGGPQMPTDAVPTSVVRGPDGAIYISQLTGFPFEKGDANIWRVRPGQSPTVYASGLTNLTDLDFAADGTLYAVEISSNGLRTGPIGALVKITPGASVHETILGELFAPYGVAIRGDFAYVSICAVCPGDGEVIKVELD
jgi:hypothetical protein